VIEVAAPVLPARIRDAIVAHARAELPNEACGLVAGDGPAAAGGRPTRWIPTRNAVASPYRFEIHSEDLLRASLDIDDAGEVVWAIVHSHVGTPARPSSTDVRGSHHPAALQLIVSLAPGEADPATHEPRLRAWRIDGADVREVELSAG
jgi:proteasome lid subunit RPN8/RPN11